MATETFSGAYRRAMSPMSPGDNPWYVERSAPVVHVVGDEHTEDAGPDDYATVWEAPPTQPTAPPSPEMVDDWTLISQGQVLDHSPVLDHAAGTSPLVRSDVDAAAQLMALHSDGHGAEHAAVHDQAYAEMAGERYWEQSFEGLDASKPISDEARRRGLNGDELNNPPLDSYGGKGFRLGVTQWFGVDRKFRAPTRQHDDRPLMVNTAYADPGSDPVPTPYGTPYRSDARFRRTWWQSPIVRREPVPVDELATTDAIAARSPVLSDFVVG